MSRMQQCMDLDVKTVQSETQDTQNAQDARRKKQEMRDCCNISSFLAAISDGSVLRWSLGGPDLESVDFSLFLRSN